MTTTSSGEREVQKTTFSKGERYASAWTISIRTEAEARKAIRVIRNRFALDEETS